MFFISFTVNLNPRYTKILKNEYITVFLFPPRYYSRFDKYNSNIKVGGFGTSTYNFGVYKIYPHGFENSVVIVENNTTITATAIQRILTAPITYAWLLLIFIFVVFRCGLQWLFESNATSTAIKRQKCIFTCQDTVHLSCGVVLNTKLFETRRYGYGYTLLAHGVTLVPLIAGMFISGLMYGDYLMHTEIPNIDSIQALEQSNLRIFIECLPDFGNYSRYSYCNIKSPAFGIVFLFFF